MGMLRARWIALSALGLAACSTDLPLMPEASLGGRSSNYTVTPQYLVLGKNNRLPDDFADQIAAAGGTVVSVIPQIGVAVVDGGSRVANAVGRMAWTETVAPDLTVQWTEQPALAAEGIEAEGVAADAHSFDPNTESFYGFQWAPQSIDAPTAWANGITGQGARVAVLDGGIHGSHVDLVNRIDVARSAAFISPPWNSDVGTFWHGTHVAGIVAASANGIGTIGIAPEATIIGVKVLHNGSGPFSAIIAGIVYAATPIAEGGAGAHVINMSLGATLNGKDPAIKAAVRELMKAVDRATTFAYQQGVTVIASNGNGATNYDLANELVKTPAQNAHVISVSSTGPTGWVFRNATNFSDPSYFTDYGKSLTFLAGPGGSAGLLVVEGNGSNCSKTHGAVTIVRQCYVFDMVFAPVRGAAASNTTYGWAQGTSMSAPAVAGIAALLIQRNGGPMHPSQIRTRLEQAAQDLGKPGNDEYYGAGYVNAWAAVR